jgi:hypothetical protein
MTSLLQEDKPPVDFSYRTDEFPGGDTIFQAKTHSVAVLLKKMFIISLELI